MAKGEEIDLDAAPAGASNKKLIIIMAIIMVVAVAAAVGITLFLVGGSQGGGCAEEVVEAPKVATYIPMKAMTVGFTDNGPAKFLQIEIALMTYNPEVEVLIQTHMPVLRNDILNTLAGASYAQLSSAEGKEQMRSDLLTLTQKILSELEGVNGVDGIYFTKLIMQ